MIHLSLICFTDGREGLLQRTLDSFDKMIKLDGDMKWLQRLLIDDSANPSYNQYIVDNFLDAGRFTGAIFHPIRLGFCRSIWDAWRRLEVGSDFVFHLEDDFLFLREIQLRDMVRVLRTEPDLAQIALVRQPWNETEKKAGGLIESRLDQYQQWSTLKESYIHNRPAFVGPDSDRIYWLRHRSYFTTNPCLYPRNIPYLGWPLEKHCEGVFTHKLLKKGLDFAHLGSFGDKPTVWHIGDQRVGKGY